MQDFLFTISFKGIIFGKQRIMPAEITRIILHWYQQSKRELPWRNTKDPYVIWISEIILQQTRMEQGLPYFHRFVQRFPDITSLASASEDEVLKLWQGLGYYSRARNMHHTAKRIHADYQGVFPESFDELKKLKGIGDYTASLIASVCFNKPYAVADGNVIRLISRLYAVKEAVDSSKGRAEIKELAARLTDTTRPGDFNQAMMDFGALICTPQKPQCPICPLQSFCKASNHENPEHFPVKKQKKSVRKRYLHYFYIHNSIGFLLRKRTHNDIWKNLYELPLIETEKESVITETNIRKAFQTDIEDYTFLYEFRHKLTHQELHIRFYKVELDDMEIFKQIEDLVFATFSNINQYALPKPVDLFLTNLKTENK